MLRVVCSGGLPSAGRNGPLHHLHQRVGGHGGAGAVVNAVGIDQKIRAKYELVAEQVPVDNKQNPFCILPGGGRAWVCGSAQVR